MNGEIAATIARVALIIVCGEIAGRYAMLMWERRSDVRSAMRALSVSGLNAALGLNFATAVEADLRGIRPVNSLPWLTLAFLFNLLLLVEGTKEIYKGWGHVVWRMVVRLVLIAVICSAVVYLQVRA